jgi:hypothetical protein
VKSINSVYSDSYNCSQLLIAWVAGNDTGVINHVHGRSGSKDYVLYKLETSQCHDSSIKKSILWKQNRSGIWEEWLVIYQNECIQFYDPKDTALTTPCAQVSIKSIDSVHNIDDQQAGNTIFRHCFLVETPQHSYRFSAQSSKEQTSWVVALRKGIMQLKTQYAINEDKRKSQMISCDSQLKAAAGSNGCRSSPEPSSTVKSRSETVCSMNFLSKVVHEGCLWKQEKKSSQWKYWKFILTDENLLCFKSYKKVQNGDRPMATIPVSLITQVSEVPSSDSYDIAIARDGSKRAYPFEVVTSNGRSYLLAASSADVCNVWMAAIRRII